MALSQLNVDSSYRLDGVEETGVELGRGAYGVVTVVKYKGMRCAAKKLHPVLLESFGGERVLDRFIEECRLYCQLRHPHIVQFLGYYQQDKAPVLVMELLSTDLGRCIDSFGVLPNEISFSILHHVALGLQYLHERSEPIIHRNITAFNILLTDDMTAKIGDFGESLVLTPSIANRPMTHVPGNYLHMPPEAVPEEPIKYDTKLDIFSYGVLMVHTLSGQFPCALGGKELSEADRRQKYLEAIGSEHPLMGLILQCLSNSPADRPAARELVHNTSFFDDKLDALCKFHQQEKSQRKQEDCARSFETILSRAIENIPASEISTYVSSVAAVESISEDQPASEVIRYHTSYLNYHLVEDMVEKFGDDKLKADMRKYRTNLKKLRKQTTISDFLVISHGKHALEPPRGNYVELSVKLDEEGEDTTMEDMERIRRSIAHKMSLPPHTVLFYTVEEGSVVVKFLVDRRKMGQTLAMKCEGLVELKFQENVLEIKVDGSVLNMNQQEGDLSSETEVELQQQHRSDGQLKRLRGENVVLRRENSTLGEENSTLRRENSTLGEENSTLRRNVSTLGREISALRGEISTLRGENVALQQEITCCKQPKPGWWEGLGTKLITGFKSRVYPGMSSEVDTSSINDSLLRHDDQDEIMSFLHSLSDKNIYDLGIALGISHQRLTDANKGASFLGNVILDWLNRVDKVGKPSWSSLVSALRDPMVKQTGIANNIAAKKHKTWTLL